MERTLNQQVSWRAPFVECTSVEERMKGPARIQAGARMEEAGAQFPIYGAEFCTAVQARNIKNTRRPGI